MLDEDNLEVDLLLFFRYKGVVEDRNLTKSVKKQDFKLEKFFVKKSKVENIVD